MRAVLSTITPDAYFDLVKEFPLRPIRDRGSNDYARAIMRRLNGKQLAAIRDYKLVLISLIADYERSAGFTLNTDHVTPADVVRHLLGERDMSVSALAKEIHVAQSSLSDMLNGRRDWSKAAIIGICDFFKLRPGLFLRRGPRKTSGLARKSA